MKKRMKTIRRKLAVKNLNMMMKNFPYQQAVKMKMHKKPEIPGKIDSKASIWNRFSQQLPLFSYSR